MWLLPALPNRAGGFPASGFPAGGFRWAGSGLPRSASGSHARTAPAWATLTPVSAAGWSPATGHRVSQHRAPRRKPCGTAAALAGGGTGWWFPPRLCVPSLHGRYPLLRFYGRSDPDRPVPRRLPWFPDSCVSDFRPCGLQTVAVCCRTRSTPSTPAALFRSGIAVCARRLARAADRIEVTFWRFDNHGVAGGAFSFRWYPRRVAMTRSPLDTARFLTAQDRTCTARFLRRFRRTSADTNVGAP